MAPSNAVLLVMKTFVISLALSILLTLPASLGLCSYPPSSLSWVKSSSPQMQLCDQLFSDANPPGMTLKLKFRILTLCEHVEQLDAASRKMYQEETSP